MANWPRNPVIYEINTWLWLDFLSQKYEIPITLANIPRAEWDEIRQMGFDAVWLMGIWERSPESVVVSNLNSDLVKSFKQALPDYKTEDNIGSAYAIRNYTVDSRLGGNEALAAARADLAERDLCLMLDFVPNHVARDHPWVTAHPEYFIQGTIDDLLRSGGEYFESNYKILACGKDPHFPAWQDTAQINLFNSDLRLAAARTLVDMASMCDGVRCDMAMLALSQVFAQTWGDQAGAPPATEYWQDVIDAVHQDQPDFLFLAEEYWDQERSLIQSGFDYCYDKGLYDRLVGDSVEQISAHLTADPKYQAYRVRFIENHDEKRAAEVFSPRKELLAAITIATIPGAKLFHEGQLEGREIRTPVFLRRRAEEAIHLEKYRFYQQLIRTASSPLVRDGKWSDCTVSGWENNFTYLHLLAWSLQQEHQTLLVVLNYGATRSQGLIHLPYENLAGSNWRLVDLFKGDVFIRSGKEMTGPGLFVDLAPWDFHFLWFARPVE